MEQKKKEEKLSEAFLDQETNGVMIALVSLFLSLKTENNAPFTRIHDLIWVVLGQASGTVHVLVGWWYQHLLREYRRSTQP